MDGNYPTHAHAPSQLIAIESFQALTLSIVSLVEVKMY